ncbi:MAG: hypothetical protein NTW21_26740 [Verrucomicrobia bacterium]|nr:hypothetical protein [Verrucomicrobiota bacterium]
MKHYMFALLLPLAALTAVSGTRAEETQADAKPAPQKREFTIDKQYLNILIKRGGPAHRMRLTFPDGSISEISMCIPDASEQPGSWAVVDVAPFKGKSLTLEAVDRLPENFLHAFSIAEVEVYDEHGTNIALASRGTGVTVNSTYHGSGQELAAHRWYCPLHYDAGFKWARVGYHDDPINWHWVEKENGLLAIDPETDKAVTELVGNGVEIIMSLGFGNRLYSGPATRDVPQLWEWNYSVLYPRLSDQAAERSWCGSFPATEMEKAKYVAQVFTRDSGLGIESFFCEMYCPTYGLLDLSLLRRSFDADPIAPLQPQAAYYVTRNLRVRLRECATQHGIIPVHRARRAGARTLARGTRQRPLRGNPGRCAPENRLSPGRGLRSGQRRETGFAHQACRWRHADSRLARWRFSADHPPGGSHRRLRVIRIRDSEQLER